MSLPTLIPIILTMSFGIIAIIFSLKYENLKKKLFKQVKAQEEKVFEAAVMASIEEKIGLSFSLDDIAQILAKSLLAMLPQSIISCVIVKPAHLVLEHYSLGHISSQVLEKAKKQTLHSLAALDSSLAQKPIEEHLQSKISQDTSALNSFFSIALLSKGEVLGVILVGSTKVGKYKQSEISTIYHLTTAAFQMLLRLHDALTIEKEKLMAMIGSLADGVLMIDKNKELSITNDSALQLLQIQKDHPTIADIFMSFPKEADIPHHIEKAIQNKEGLSGKELNLGSKTVQLFITPVTTTLADGISSQKTPHEKVIGVSVLLNDITLEKAIQQMKEDFTNMVVHELRAPLAAIKDSSDLILESASKLSQDEITNLLKIIHRQSARMLDDVSSILDAAKLEAGRFVLQKTTSNIEKVVEEKLEIFSPQALSKNIKLEKHIQSGVPEFLFDQKRIGQVINNLLSNSIKYTHEGGSIELHVKTENNFLSLSVKDTGVGIPKDKQGHLFTKFFQVVPTPSSSGGNNIKPNFGTGLGLYITKGIIDAHNGTIYVESEEGKGTTISFSIPIEFEQKQPLTSSTPPKSPSEAHPDLPLSPLGTTIH